jgi:chaperonin GroEL
MEKESLMGDIAMDNIKQVKSNVVNQTETREYIGRTLETLNDILSKSLGPYGATTIIQDKLSMNHAITKDGYTILNKIKFDNEIATTILEIVKKVSRNLVKEVGDGSTSAIVVSNALFQQLLKVSNEHNIPRKDILEVLEAYEKALSELVEKESIAITEENFDKIRSIASVSNNNDDKAGDLIFHIYEKIGGNGFISLETSTNVEDSYIITEGIELPRGNISSIYANKPDKTTTEFEKPFIFMCNEALDENDLAMMAEVLGKAMKFARPLVVIAKGYDTEVKNFFHINKIQNRALDVAVVDYAIVNNYHRESFEDLAIYLGASIYDKYGGERPSEFDVERLGNCAKAIINETSSKFIEGFGEREKIDERIGLIEDQMKEVEKKEKYIDTTEEIFQLRKRIANLNCLIATLYVGGSSDLERETRKYLMEDAVFACQSAIRSGYVTGGNLIIPRVMKDNWNDIIFDMTKNNELVKTLVHHEDRKQFFNNFSEALYRAFAESFYTVLTNKYGAISENYEKIEHCIDNNLIFNLKKNTFEKLEETSIINSVKTDIEIMKASFSIIGLLATSNQFVSVQYQ